MITIAGGENIGAQAGSGFPSFSTEVLVKDDPQVYIADSGSMSEPGEINKRAGFGEAHGGARTATSTSSRTASSPGRVRASPKGSGSLVTMIHPEAFHHRMTRRARTGTWPGVLLAGGILAVCLALGLALGPVSLSLSQLWHLVTAGPVQGDLESAIFWQIRMPRVLVAVLVGAALAVAGVILQDLFLNPLHRPVRDRRLVGRRAGGDDRHRAPLRRPLW